MAFNRRVRGSFFAVFGLVLLGFGQVQSVRAQEFYVSPFMQEQVNEYVEDAHKPSSPYKVAYTTPNKVQKFRAIEETLDPIPTIQTSSQGNIEENIKENLGEFPRRIIRTRNTNSYGNRNNIELSEAEKIQNAISYASLTTGLPESVIKALVKKESSFNPRAVSRTGARGLTQLMPSTASSECGLSEDELFDINKNISCGASYLKKQLDYFQRLDLALAAYNAGPGAVRRAMQQAESSDINMVTALLKAETAPYVKKIMQDVSLYES